MVTTSDKSIAAYGSWPSDLSGATITENSRRLGEPRVTGSRNYWTERRTDQGSITFLCASGPDNDAVDVTDDAINVHSTVHEYGGSSYCITPDGFAVANAEDQSWWLLTDSEQIRLTPPDVEPGSVRLGEAIMHPDGVSLIAVRETHAQSVVNDLVRVALDGSGMTSIHSDHDFYAMPTLSPDRTRLSFCTWDHPQMPWDGTQLHLADFSDDGSITNIRVVAGGLNEAVQQPLFDNEGCLHYISDRTGWWNLYKEGTDESLYELDAEFGLPMWQQDYRTYGFTSDNRLVCTWRNGTQAHLGTLRDGELTELQTPFSDFSTIRITADDQVLTIAASPTQRSTLVLISLEDGQIVELAHSGASPDQLTIATADEITFDGTAGPTHALFYAPMSPTHCGPEDERPPLLVWSHGGPTGSTSRAYNPAIQYWTSRGYAVVDVNYSGSTGYGREYRNRLKGNWGVLDAADCIAAAEHLAASDKVDPARMVIEGGSAGGYTTLCALAFHDTFTAGVSRYGIADAELLARDTHKFESRYLDGLIGPYPQAADIYRQRSPIHFTDQFSAPMLILQGGKDKVVPPEQAEQMVKALDKAGLTYAYILFEDEPHGFRLRDSIIRSIEAQEAFMAAVFGITPAASLPALDLRNT
ncbi:MAG: alpha/beta hydrolase family protein [Acidimicrobiales bacterium]